MKTLLEFLNTMILIFSSLSLFGALIALMVSRGYYNYNLLYITLGIFLFSLFIFIKNSDIEFLKKDKFVPILTTEIYKKPQIRDTMNTQEKKDKIFKAVFAIALLIVLYLWSGGLYSYKTSQNGLPQFRINKITGDVQYLKKNRWESIIKD